MDALSQYDISSDEDDKMDTGNEQTVQPSTSRGINLPTTPAAVVSSVDNPFDRIEQIQDSDDEDDIDIPNFNLAVSSDLHLDTVLPQPKHLTGILPLEDSEMTAIPPKKVYGDEEKPQPRPITSTFANLVANKKSGGGPVQISIPSLKNFEDEDSGQPKRKMLEGPQKTSSLFAILPQPKHDFSFRLGSADVKDKPNAISSASLSKDKAPISTKPTTLIPHAVKQASTKRSAPVDHRLEKVKAKYLKQEFNVKVVSNSSAPQKPKNLDADSDDEDDGSSSDFFSLDTKINEKIDYVEVELPPELRPKINVTPTVEEEMDRNGDEANEPLPAPFDQGPQREQEDLLRYIQPSRKGKVKIEDVNIIDVNADDLRPQTSDWLKTITDTSMIPPRKAVLPGGVSKRKHQITYLAAEAKAREEELQNQWAANRHAKRQTQNKYGF